MMSWESLIFRNVQYIFLYYIKLLGDSIHCSKCYKRQLNNWNTFLLIVEFIKLLIRKWSSKTFIQKCSCCKIYRSLCFGLRTNSIVCLLACSFVYEGKKAVNPLCHISVTFEFTWANIWKFFPLHQNGWTDCMALFQLVPGESARLLFVCFFWSFFSKMEPFFFQICPLINFHLNKYSELP